MSSADLFPLFRIPNRGGVVAFLLLAVGFTSSCAARTSDETVHTASGGSCDGIAAPITSGYGARGPYNFEVKDIPNPIWRRKRVSILIPRGIKGRMPVIFFSHAFGAWDWQGYYPDLVSHIASKGYIVIFSPYPKFLADDDERYSVLWKGFEAAVAKYGQLMDLTRVGFVGHSYGAAATPAMAYRGIVQRGWGKHGAFMYMMAPSYAYEITNSQLKSFPQHVVEVIQIFENDTTNDHRMAIDLYRSIALPKHYFLEVSSATFQNCRIEANHAMPTSNNPSLRLKEYAVFRPLDAIADWAFNGKAKGLDALVSMTRPAGPKDPYQPLRLVENPRPAVPERNFRFPWSDRRNERMY